MKKLVKIIIAVAVSIALLCLTLFVIKVAGVNSVRNTEGEATKEVVPGEEIAIGSNNVLVAENGGKALYVNPASLNLIVEDKATGIRWSAIDPQGSDAEKSLITVNYIGDDNIFTAWDSYKYCVANESYTLQKIENGVRINMNINEGASARFYEYMPQKMSVSNYEEVFVGGLERLVEEGTLEKAQATKYKNTLSLIYKRSRETESYNVNFVGSPPRSAVTQLIELSKLVGYTTEMLLGDAEEFGFEVDFTEPAVFDITLDAVLENGELVVSLPVKNIINGNDFYTLQNIEVLTNFSLVKSENVTEGYLFIPDGAGALMRMNTYDSKVPDYVRGFYDNDYYTDYYYKPEYGQELMMPLFGMLCLEGTAEPYGFLGIVENGADTAYVEAMLASGGEDGVGRKYNKVYTTYDVAQYEWVPVFGEYSDNQSKFLSTAPKTEEDYVLRYLFYTGEEVSYYNMAKDYQSYLCKGSVPNVYPDKAEMFLEVVGTLSLEERFLGIPYDTKYSMTTYKELLGILEDLDGRHANIAYKGVFDGGMNHKLMNRGKLVSKNGSKKDLEALIAKVEGLSDDLYMETDFLRIYDTSGNGYMKMLHGLQDYSKSAVEIYGYSTEFGMFQQMTNHYQMLSPKYLVDVVGDFKKNVKDSYNYYVNGVANQYYADYGTNYISPYEAQRLAGQALGVLAEDGSKLALQNPRADRLTNGTIAVDVSRESSNLNSFYTSIPFRQLVLNGMMEYTTTTANNNSDPAKYYLMQAIETGAQPKFTVSAKNVDALKDSTYSYYFSIQYEFLKDDIKMVYDAYAEAMQEIGTAQIVNHTMLAQDVFLTEYANGTRVVSNYTLYEFDYNGTTIKANDYLILKGGN